jgi:hypothetical protein
MVGDTHSGRHSERDTVRETQWETHTVGDTVRVAAPDSRVSSPRRSCSTAKHKVANRN